MDILNSTTYDNLILTQVLTHLLNIHILQAKLKKKDGPKYKAQSHFDEFYGSVFGEQWAPIKEALFRKNKYVAVVNNYGDTKETVEFLENKGKIIHDHK